ncbi:MAG: hypothetical protein P8Y10_12210 [Gemmatimonadales bacterium]|jgi:hypothetical protein
MFTMRKWLGLAALTTLGGLIITSNPSGPGGDDRVLTALWLLLVPLAITIGGLAGEAYWSRWLALAAGVAVLPWGTALTVTPTYGHPALPRLLLLAASLLLLLSLTGRSMFAHYEGRAGNTAWSGRLMGLVRWTIICNIASVLSLYLFVVAYDYELAWQFAILASLFGGLVAGVLLLARGRTVGILIVGLCSACFVPVGGLFVWREATYAGEALLFAAIFLPGVLTAWISLVAFGKPIWRFLAAA